MHNNIKLGCKADGGYYSGYCDDCKLPALVTYWLGSWVCSDCRTSEIISWKVGG